MTQRNCELIYGLDDRPRPLVAILAALQHPLAIITAGLLICQGLGVSPHDTNLIVSMSLVISAIAYRVN